MITEFRLERCNLIDSELDNSGKKTFRIDQVTLKEMWIECPYADYMELRKLFLEDPRVEGDITPDVRERLTHSSIQPDMVVQYCFQDWQYEPEDGSSVELHVLLTDKETVLKSKYAGSITYD